SGDAVRLVWHAGPIALTRQSYRSPVAQLLTAQLRRELSVGGGMTYVMSGFTLIPRARVARRRPQTDPRPSGRGSLLSPDSTFTCQLTSSRARVEHRDRTTVL